MLYKMFTSTRKINEMFPRLVPFKRKGIGKQQVLSNGRPQPGERSHALLLLVKRNRWCINNHVIILPLFCDD